MIDIKRGIRMKIIENILVVFVGKPILWFIKSFRWVLLLFGIFFNGISIYNPITKTMESHFTIIPFIIGFILFCTGLAVKRYDDLVKEYWELSEELSEKDKL
jgi:hypothetical protein